MNNEQKKDEIKTKLIKLNYFKTPDGKQLYELTLSELEEIYIAKKIKGKLGKI
ncbi:Fur-regulated basic protein FbpA [Priestia megaterium]|uniref:Fur-regulated basic protein FbpA n=1 Tax=Priestia megaterium TaxID=1404 RepID=UPI00211B9B1F|nr:Fur-regulated basic protein FbpA [Priestia megaterium]